MPAVLFSPVFNDAQLDAAGNPFAGAKVFTYVAGSVNTKQAAFTDADGLTAQTNPIILNARGEPTTGQIWLEAAKIYKFVLAPPTDTDPPTSPVRTIDNIRGINDTTLLPLSEWLGFSGAPTFISTTSFSLIGDKTSDFHAGRRIKCLVTAGTVYSTISKSEFTTLTTVTIEDAVLDSGLSQVSFGINSAVNFSDPLASKSILSEGDPLSEAESLLITRPSVSTVTIAADKFVVANTAGTKAVLSSISVTPALTVNGANGLDTGAEAASTFYYLWVIWNGTAVAGLFSLSVTAPTMPTGYTHKGLAGAIRNDSASNFIDMSQRGRNVSIPENQVLADGSATAVTDVSLSAAIPPEIFFISARIKVTAISTPAVDGRVFADTAGNIVLGVVGVVSTTDAAQSANNQFLGMLRTAQILRYNVNNLNADLDIFINGWRW